MTILEQIYEDKVIAILRGIEQGKILPVCQALYDGGIKMIEVTFNQSSSTGVEDTCLAIKSISEHFGDRVRVGAGTVMTEHQAMKAFEAGAEYMISPHFSEALVKKIIALGAVALPGVMTPSEMVAAYESGATAVKIFPIHHVGGPDYLKDVQAPISHIPMLAVGGVTGENAASYIKAGAAGLGVGGGLIRKELIEAEDYEGLTQDTRQLMMRCKEA